MEIEDIEIKGDFIELNKLLKFSALVSTGGEASEAIKSSMVKVDNLVETAKRKKIRVGQLVSYMDETIRVTNTK